MAAIEEAAGRADEATARLHDVYDRMRLSGADQKVLATIAAQPSMTRSPASARPGTPAADLTDREITVLRLLESHLTFAEIGKQLIISRNTVKTYATRLYRKLGVSSRSDAIREARRRGLLRTRPFG
jgi:LuxR family maltose regulon positive regulatory protein